MAGFMAFSTALGDALDMASKAYERRRAFPGSPPVSRDLDRALGGLQSPIRIVPAGRPSMGKTALATNLAFNIAMAYRTETKSDGVEELDGTSWASSRWKCPPNSSPPHYFRAGAVFLRKDPPRPISEDEFHRLVKATQGAAIVAPLYRSYGRHFHRSARGAGTQAEAAAGPRFAGSRLPATADRLGEAARRAASRR